MKVTCTARIVIVSIVLFASFMAGCGKAKKAKESKEAQELAARQQQINDLKQIGLMYHNYLNANNDKAPASADDFMKPKGHLSIDADLARVVQKVKSGQYVLIYGLTMKDLLKSGSSIVGYEKDAPVSGGIVLMGIGSTQYMTAAEFQSAPKASGK
jgi:hypothetical protein